MIVISDTSVICYLVLIEQITLLSQLFGKVLIPQAVYTELCAEGAPPQLKEWITNIPDCLEIYPTVLQDDPVLAHLHLGEIEAISLAIQLKADLVILDEKAARRTAQSKGLKVTGLLGILDLAASQKMIELPPIIMALKQTTFRASPNLLQSLLNRHQKLGETWL